MDSALEPVGNALYKVLNVPSLVGTYAAGVCAGVKKVWPKPPTNVQPGDFPLVWFELASEDNRSGLGRGPWLLELDVRVHTFVVSDMNDAQRITREVVRLLRAHETDTLPVAGWSPWYQPHDRNVLLPFEQLAGLPVTELVTMGRLYVEEPAA